MLVAVGILAAILPLLYGTFSRTLAGRDHAAEALARYASARAAIQWLEQDLEGSFVSGLYPTGIKRFVSPGKPSESVFGEPIPLLDVTTVSARGTTPIHEDALGPEGADDGVLGAGDSRGDQVRVRYFLERADADATGDPLGLELVRYEQRPPEREELDLAVRAVIARSLDGVELRFFDGASWREHWDSTASGSPVQGTVPRAVQILVTSTATDGDAPIFVSAVYLPMGAPRG